MIYSTILLPSALSTENLKAGQDSAYCDSSVRILDDLIQNCFLLVDEGGVIEKELFNAVRNSWPIQYRKRGLERLTLLRCRGRFVRLAQIRYDLVQDCTKIACKHGVGISLKNETDALIVGENCHTCAKAYLKEVRPPCQTDIVNAWAEYSLSNFYKKRRIMRIILKNGEWTKKNFENNILAPILRFAKHVKIIDRQIGRTARKDKEELSENYFRTLHWIIQLFSDISTVNNRTIEIYCGIIADKDKRTKEPSNKAELRNKLNALETFERNLQPELKKKGITIRVYKKKELLGKEVPHARYLTTDQQIGYNIDRGFDILRDDNMIRDVDVSVCDNQKDLGKIVNAARLLPDFQEL